MKRTLKDYAFLMLKGIGMGAADVVPGVSGGTIAFIVGIYEELINSIKSINAQSLKLFFTGKFAQFWKAINANFLLSVLSGILLSIFSLAKLITYLLENHPVMVWAFFFGLVLASTWSVSKRIKKFSISRWVSFGLGAVFAYFITVATPANTPDDLWFIFLCGAIAICAMILPGISGSFILLLLGKYIFIMNSIQTLNIPVMAVFAMGAAIGLISFSNVLSWLLKNYHDITIATLGGFMLGSLNKVWPWKEAVEYYVDRHGIEKPLIEKNIMPDSFIWQASALAIGGFVLVLLLEKISERSAENQLQK